MSQNYTLIGKVSLANINVIYLVFLGLSAMKAGADS